MLCDRNCVAIPSGCVAVTTPYVSIVCVTETVVDSSNRVASLFEKTIKQETNENGRE